MATSSDFMLDKNYTMSLKDWYACLAWKKHMIQKDLGVTHD